MFIFGNKTSEEMGIKCVQYTLRKKAKRMYNTYSIPGKPEPFIESENAFDPVTIEVECDIMEESYLDAIFAWLNGKGILIDERFPDKYRIAQVLERIDTIAVNDEIRTIRIPFLCSAFMYAVDNEPIYFQGYSANVNINGTYYSEPKYIFRPVSGSEFAAGNDASYKLNVNGKEFSVDLIAEDWNHNIVLDSEKQLAYYEDTGEIILERTKGDIPYLDNEITNEISWSSSSSATNNFVIGITIYKNERWL